MLDILLFELFPAELPHGSTCFFLIFFFMIGSIVFLNSSQDLYFPEFHIFLRGSMLKLFDHQQIHTFLESSLIIFINLSRNKPADLIHQTEPQKLIIRWLKLTVEIEANNPKGQCGVISILICIFDVHIQEYTELVLHYIVYPISQDVGLCLAGLFKVLIRVELWKIVFIYFLVHLYLQAKRATWTLISITTSFEDVIQRKDSLWGFMAGNRKFHNCRPPFFIYAGLFASNIDSNN